MKVLLFGTFDHLHPGHLFVFEQAKKRGNVTVVIARDKTVERVKGALPDDLEDTRLQNVRIAFPEADVVLGHPDNYLEPIRRVQPDLIVLWYDKKLQQHVSDADFPCPVERLPAFEPEKYKSSLFKVKRET